MAARIISSFILALLLSASPANAAAVQWYLQGVTFDDGGTATGSFLYDDITGDYSAIAVTTSSNGSFGTAYDWAPPGGGASTSTRLPMSNTTTPIGGVSPVLAFTFESALTNAGGTTNIFVDIGATGGSQEGTCAYSITCAGPGGITTPLEPQRWVTNGTVTTIAPATLLSYDELVDGDLSGLAAAPTILVIGAGVNTLTGQMSTANDGFGSVTDFDNFAFSVGTGLQIDSISVTHTFTGDATSIAWYAGADRAPINPWDFCLGLPATECQAYFSSGTAAYFSILMPLGLGIHQFGFQGGNLLPPPPYDATYAYVLTINASATGGPVPTAVNDGPIPVIEGIAEVIPVGVNDTGFTDPVTVTVTTPPTKGTIGAISPPGPAAGMTITYTANIGTVGGDGFVYEMSDGTPASDTAGVFVLISPNTDADADGVPDTTDNCTLVANASQCDSDADGYGNRCDGDMNNNGATNSQDYVLFRQELGTVMGDPYNKADINCNGVANSQDYVLFRQLLGSPPGPSGLVP